MGTLYGRCTNEMFCPIGASGRLVQVPTSSSFVCPGCGKVLLPPNGRRTSPILLATVFSIGVGCAILFAFAAGALLGSLGRHAEPDRIEAFASQPLAGPPPVRLYAHLAMPPPLAVKRAAHTGALKTPHQEKAESQP